MFSSFVKKKTIKIFIEFNKRAEGEKICLRKKTFHIHTYIRDKKLSI